MAYVFHAPREIITGRGCLASLGEKAKPLGRHALLVTGRHAAKAAGFTDRATQLLGESGVAVTLFDGVQPEPTVHNVDDGRSLVAEHACDLVIGLGGGSAIDAAKAIAGLARETGATEEFLDGRLKVTKRALPMIAVPTTAGTGAEATPNAVLTDPERTLKQSLRASSMLPDVAIVDPELTLPCPPKLTAYAGMDALVQAIESYLSIRATPLTEGLSLHAARLLLRSLERAVKDGRHLPAREDCAYASLMAGIALANARLGAVHGLAHPLGVRYGIPHGLTCAVLLPPVLRMNRPFAVEKFAALDALAGGEIIASVEKLMAAVGVPLDLREYHLRAEDFKQMADESLPSGSTQANPKKMTSADFVALLDAVK